jgi:hypothetical protein
MDAILSNVFAVGQILGNVFAQRPLILFGEAGLGGVDYSLFSECGIRFQFRGNLARGIIVGCAGAAINSFAVFIVKTGDVPAVPILLTAPFVHACHLSRPFNSLAHYAPQIGGVSARHQIARADWLFLH